MLAVWPFHNPLPKRDPTALDHRDSMAPPYTMHPALPSITIEEGEDSSHNPIHKPDRTAIEKLVARSINTFP